MLYDYIKMFGLEFHNTIDLQCKYIHMYTHCLLMWTDTERCYTQSED